MTCDDCDHPSKEFYLSLGFDEPVAEKIIEGFHAPDDYPTEVEWLEMGKEERLKYQ